MKLKHAEALKQLQKGLEVAKQWFEAKKYRQSAKLYVDIAKFINKWDTLVIPEVDKKEEKRKEEYKKKIEIPKETEAPPNDTGR
jgi:hypothetical protein